MGCRWWDCSPQPWGSPFRAARFRANLRLSKFVPDEFVEPARFLSPTLSARHKNAPRGGVFVSGGEGGIRTHGTLTRTPDFESGTFDHSATSPKGSRGLREPAILRAGRGRDKRGRTGLSCRAGRPTGFPVSRSQVSTAVSGFGDGADA